MKIKTLSSGRVSSGAEAIRKRRLWASTALVAFSVVAVVGHGRAQEIIDGSMETVDGDGTGTKPSPWLLPGSLILGDQSAGMLILQNGGLASATDVQLGARASGEGQLWLHGSVADRGVLETGQVSVGAGGGTISFDGGILRLTRDEADLFAGFDDGDIRIGYSNAYIDTQEHSVATSVGLEGVGGLLKRGSGTLTLTGHNRYQSGTTVYEGVLAVDGGSITHTAGHVVVAASGGDDASLIISNGGVVSGYNSQIGWGSGTTGKALVTGARSSWLSAGTLEIGRFGKGGLTIENGGLVESRDARIGYAQSAVGEVLVSGAGSNWRLDDGLEVGRTGKGALTIEDGGVVQSGSVFLGTNATGRGTALVSGSVTHWEVDGNLVVGRAGEGILEISEGALISADRVELGMFSNASGTLRLSGAAGARGVLETEQVSETSGEGSLIFDGGVLRLTANQYNLFAGFEAGDVTISAGGAYIDTHGFSVHSAYALGGSGGLIKQGNGSLTLHGANTHTGGTIVEAGTLVLKGGDALADTGAVELQGGVLRLDDDETIGSLAGVAGAHISLQANTLFTGGSGNSSVLASSISGTGGFEKQGAGTLVYTGDGSGFDGTTRVVDGALIVGVGGNGALGGAVEVLNGGVLGGSGDLGALTVASGGVLKPGNSIGTQSVSGNATFENGSVFEVEVDNAGSGDRLAVSGHAFINGGTVNVRAENGTDDGSTYDPATTYTILTATGGVSGAFSGVTENFAFLDAALAYDPDAVLLTLSRNDTDFSELAKTHNQRVAAIGAQGLGSGNQLFDAILGLSDAQAPGAFDAISGEIYGSIRSGFIADSSFLRDAASERVRSAFGIGVPASAPEFWSMGFGSWQNFSSDGNAAQYTHDTRGLLLGGDAEVAGWNLGLMAGYSRSSLRSADRASAGSSDNYHLGIYGGRQWEALTFSGGFAYTRHEVDVRRSVAFAGFSDALSAGYDAGTAQGFGELGYRVETPVATVTPFAGIAHISHSSGGYAEEGGAAALEALAQTSNVTFTTLGMRMERDVSLDVFSGALHGAIGWQHAFDNEVALARHALAGGDAFSVAGAPIAADTLLLQAGFSFALSDAAKLGAAYGGQVARGAARHTFDATLSISF
ncbi:autotransporter domain-containing protein [Nitratireductor aquimarinus]|uniref:autotransporter outer membrane beta-barrel domain-containing protein n=1 Tax=Nitratireductor TaxID=245876 RepID=UPI0019D33CCB|nr:MULTISPECIES: autotransporter domain-containing protein [Nitratireductor]MBN7775086.1 autotransporter domain-containing protein [Nitratireductor pacificus]MBN7779947.1 autotransporter domain-containing protein [Nitratireductor pacificus]MBN7788754.1 autotransporter domain-containing protein [Nitratireductor aquimarinus]MBY6097473.1 autotransporter domain-containing protein [Nitratireductor aquimarinus]MCA1260894.1 autotransporter domain-containing protein [Nitratireductor aquimarinus]